MDNFKNVIGYDHIKHELNRIVDCINNKEKYERFGVRSPLGLLIHGNPGLGKTLIATSFLEAINRNKYLIKKDKPNGEFVRYLKDTITDAINNAPSIVLLDDLDKFANNDEGHRKTDEFIVLQSLIDDAKDKDVFFIATANDLRDMPISLLRSGRFDVKIEVNDPTPKDTALIIEHYLSNKHLSSDIDYEEIAKIVNCDSIATMESIMNEAGLIAGYNDRDVISMHDIIKASLRVVFEAPESQEDKTPKQLELAAYHEAGHVLVAELLEPGSVNLVTVSNYFSHKGGVTSISNNDDYWYDIDYMENRIKMLLAGKAATDIIYGKIDVGAKDDMRRAKFIVSRLVGEYNINSFYSFASERASDQSRYKYENELATSLATYYTETKKLIRDNINKLEKIAKELMNKEFLLQRDIKTIIN